MIHFNIPPFVGTELEYVKDAAAIERKICGDGPYTKRCSQWLENRFEAQKVLLTTSGTSALEMAAVLCDIKPGDEVVLPSFTFSSTATAFAVRGARLVFVDIRKDTMNIDETKIEQAITEKTKVICVVDYAGVAPNIEVINDIAHNYGLLVVEDAAQAVMAQYKGRALGTLADFGCYSFHETKNYSMGEGGALVIQNSEYNDRAEIIREKGTNRAQYFRGQVAKYNWVDEGSSYLPSDLLAAYLWAQLQHADSINNDRLASWQRYFDAFAAYADSGVVSLPVIPEGCKHNAHMFYLKLQDLDMRTRFISHMKDRDIACAFHYVPLHSSAAGKRFGRFDGEDIYTTAESEKLVRLPMYFDMKPEVLNAVIDGAYSFLNQELC